MELASKPRLVILATHIGVCLGGSPTFSQNPAETAPKVAGIVEYLTETISWYRGTALEQEIANEPSEVTFLNENRWTSGEIVRLAFDFARLVEKNESLKPKGKQPQEQASVPFQNQHLRW